MDERNYDFGNAVGMVIGLELDIEEEVAGGSEGEHFVERGDGERAAAAGTIVADEGDAVAGEIDVELDAIDAGGDGVAKRFEGVFGADRAGSAVPVDEDGALPHYTTIMALTRRQAIAALAAAPALAQQQQTTPGFRKANGPAPRTTPALCLYSDQMLKVGYDEMGGILKMLGFDGVDLVMQESGHIKPEHADLDVERGIEAMTGSGIDVFSISTNLTSPMNEKLRIALQWCGQMGVPVFRPGDWAWGTAEPDQRIAQVAREISILQQMAAQVGTSVALHNGLGDTFGSALWDSQMVLRAMDPRSMGYALDAGFAASQGPAAFATALRLAIPRLKMVIARDGAWAKDGGGWKFVECPLGEGMVNWQTLFEALAREKFAGPISLRVAYETKDELSAIKKDLAFLKKARAAAFGG